jgi:hypothetical protein
MQRQSVVVQIDARRRAGDPAPAGAQMMRSWRLEQVKEISNARYGSSKLVTCPVLLVFEAIRQAEAHGRTSSAINRHFLAAANCQEANRKIPKKYLAKWPYFAVIPRKAEMAQGCFSNSGHFALCAASRGERKPFGAKLRTYFS